MEHVLTNKEDFLLLLDFQWSQVIICTALEKGGDRA